MSTQSRTAPVGPTRRRSLVGAGVAPDRLSDAELREAWRFRGRFVDLKPTVAPEDDYRAFCATVRRGATLWRQRDDAGELRAMIMVIQGPAVHEGRPYFHLEFEYAFFDPEFRRTFASRLAFFATIARAFVVAGARPIYLVASTYPAGALSLDEYFPLWLPGADAGMSDWERGLRASLGAATKGYDPATGLVTMRTLPRERCRTPKRPRTRATWEAYQRCCPQWTAGYTPLCLARVTLADTARAALGDVPAMLLRDAGLRR